MDNANRPKVGEIIKVIGFGEAEVLQWISEDTYTVAINHCFKINGKFTNLLTVKAKMCYVVESYNNIISTQGKPNEP